MYIEICVLCSSKVVLQIMFMKCPRPMSLQIIQGGISILYIIIIYIQHGLLQDSGNLTSIS